MQSRIRWVLRKEKFIDGVKLISPVLPTNTRFRVFHTIQQNGCQFNLIEGLKGFPEHTNSFQERPYNVFLSTPGFLYVAIVFLVVFLLVRSNRTNTERPIKNKLPILSVSSNSLKKLFINKEASMPNTANSMIRSCRSSNR